MFPALHHLLLRGPSSYQHVVLPYRGRICSRGPCSGSRPSSNFQHASANSSAQVRAASFAAGHPPGELGARLHFIPKGRLLRHPCRPGTLCKADDAAPSDMMPAQIAPRIPVTPHCACSLLRPPRLHHPGLSRHRGIEQPGLRNCPMCLVL